jgi:NAD+ diphosphatase
VDRTAERRLDTEWIEQAWADPKTRVLVVSQSRALIDLAGGRHQLVLISPKDAPEGTRFFLGTDSDEIAYFGVSGEIAADGRSRSGDGKDLKALQLRQVGADLSARDAGLLTHAIALANWHDTHVHCPACGTPTVPHPAGHLTTCPKDGTEHFPRLDPAVIMLVIDPDDRLLLARNAGWPPGRMSVLAGFVEAGESCERAVVREVFEESGIVVSQVDYLGSQPWPMPRSLMLGFRAVAVGGQEIAIDSDEIGEARWFTRAELITAIEARELIVAPASSIARRLIEYWYGGELPDFPGAWTAPAR